MEIKQYEKIIIEALQDYRKRVAIDNYKTQEIEMALNALMRESESFQITSVCKEDLFDIFDNNSKAKEVIESMDDSDMCALAGKMADDYCDQLFWDSLKIIFEDKFM